MSRRMTSETIIFDTDWLTEADFDYDGYSVTVSIDYQAYDTLKIIAPPKLSLEKGGLFQEFDVYKLENFGPDYQELILENNDGFWVDFTRDEGDLKLSFILRKLYWEEELKGIGSIYIKGVKR